MASDWQHNPRTPRQLPRTYGLPTQRRRWSPALRLVPLLALIVAALALAQRLVTVH